MAMDADGLRTAFTRFFAERGHAVLPAAGLIAHDPTVLFTIAGMVQFKPYFTGEQAAPVPRATTIQPCFRTVDIDIIGRTARHNTFFEMLGNFSFGDYFKDLAIPYAWELVTEVLGLDPARLWVTVHESDSDATEIWQDVAHLPSARIQRMGEDNFWKMGEVGPCGPCSEIYFDRGDRFGPPGGPAHGGDERYIEIWNLVFMQYERAADGTLTDLPKKNIDTGAGLERIAAVVQGVDSIYETDIIAPVVEHAARLTGQVPGKSEPGDVALRILADHARAMTFLISDGVFPSNEGRGYVLRRIIRRAVLRAYQFGVNDLMAPELVSTVVAAMKAAYPKLERDESLVKTVVAHEEEGFRRTLRAGSALIEEELQKGGQVLSGAVAFRLHDTYGFPIDLTTEVASARGFAVDRAGFDGEMTAQRERARQGTATASDEDAESIEEWRGVLAQFGPTQFVGYTTSSSSARLLSVRPSSVLGGGNAEEDTPDIRDKAQLDVVLDVTPFYAEGGGQVGDTGVIETATGRFQVTDTTIAIDGITRHSGYLLEGELVAGEPVTASIDVERRDAIRRNHSATHLLHHALRTVLGEHVKQQGSLVEANRLRFDFSHFAPLSEPELLRVEEIVNREVLSDYPVRIYETTRTEAESVGAMAFFGEKYGDIVRVVEAGGSSIELCGGTHVAALGMIGPFHITSEGSIGANTRRIEATTGERSLEGFRKQQQVVNRLSALLRSAPSDAVEAAERLVERQRELEEELKVVRAAHLRDEAGRLASTAADGTVVVRYDGLSANELRDLALAIRDQRGIQAVGLIGAADDARAVLVVATQKQHPVDARNVASEAARIVGGGGGGTAELATAGGRDIAAIDAALTKLEQLMRAGS